MLGISACGDKQSNQSTVTDDYRYSSYTYDDNAPQYYMAGSAAASETGYYYIDVHQLLIIVICIYIIMI